MQSSLLAGTLAGKQEAGKAPANIADWAKLPRILIAEGYTPPFNPSFDYEAGKALEIAKSLNADGFRFPAAAYNAFYPTQTRYPVHPGLRGGIH